VHHAQREVVLGEHVGLEVTDAVVARGRVPGVVTELPNCVANLLLWLSAGSSV
jgi:hypothetical protein